MQKKSFIENIAFIRPVASITAQWIAGVSPVKSDFPEQNEGLWEFETYSKAEMFWRLPFVIYRFLKRTTQKLKWFFNWSETRP